MGCQAHTDYQKLEQSTPLYWCPLNIWRLSTRGRILWNFFCVFSSETFSHFIVEVLFRPRCDDISESLNPTLAVKYTKKWWNTIHSQPLGMDSSLHYFQTLFTTLFFEKMWSNLRRQTIRWSITSALPNYWLGHKEGRKVGFCQILYIWHLFKVCLMYFLCMSSHSFCASKRGWHFTPKKWCLGPKYLGGIFFIQNLSQKLSTLKWDSFGGWLAQKLKIPLLCYHITQTSWHALFEDIGHRVRISTWCHHRSQIKKTKQNVVHTFIFWGDDLDGNF